MNTRNQALNRARRKLRGEKIIFASRTGQGFDLASFSGKGRKVKLFIDEVKNISRPVSHGSLKTLGANYSKALRDAIKKAEQEILTMFSKGKIKEITKRSLLAQLKAKTFTVRLVPGPDAKFTAEVIELLKEDLPRVIFKVDPLP